jgi:hypothetical protein
MSSRVKRGAEAQITKDDGSSEGEDQDFEEEGDGLSTFKRADPEEIAKRRFSIDYIN